MADSQSYSGQAGSLDELLHALNQPLTQIRCSLELLLLTPASPEKCKEALTVALGQAERASKISSAMQLVIEIERDEETQSRKTGLARAVEAALADFAPVVECTGINIVRHEMAGCEIAAPAKSLSTALFLLLDQLFGRAEGTDTLHIEINESNCDVHLSFELVRQPGKLPGIENFDFVILRSIFRAIGGQLSVGTLDNNIELGLTFPSVTEI